MYFLSHWYGMGCHNRERIGYLTEIENYFIYTFGHHSKTMFWIFSTPPKTSILTKVYDNRLRQQGSNYYNKVTTHSSGL